jgi:hypothetical protein
MTLNLWTLAVSYGLLFALLLYAYARATMRNMGR